MTLPLSDQIEALLKDVELARASIAALRDAARQSTMDFRERDKHVMRLHNALAALLTAIQQPSESQWRPIASAPKDGTRVLLWKEGKSIVEGSWNSGGSMHMPHWSTPSGLFDPTLWHPLPPLPKGPTE
jgi:hypothetical protein